ncbi:uncharacterized protein LOC106878063 [Octopus bimaculoides]|uniref:uncharacterized protein LOC106878063 n=1 Tax=Octopus bimaculoides TaxID=37653 RepID=UPI00071CAF35|nr:uncharacterized protein LOC106878063 [Octopus bimaculoides]|eukprot:XP_014782642.1 PREDICTED: uncharacterized protein LOC106878063 [Octopus bimaculoides]
MLQGDMLTRYLFVIVLDFAMQQAIDNSDEEFGLTTDRRRSRRVPSVIIIALNFADDIALISNEISQAQQLLSRVKTSAAKIELQTNVRKTEYMPFNQSSDAELFAFRGSN